MLFTELFYGTFRFALVKFFSGYAPVLVDKLVPNSIH